MPAPPWTKPRVGRISSDYIRYAVAAQAGCVSVEDASLAAWALVHGLAMLFVDGKQPWPATGEKRDQLVDRLVSMYSIDAVQ